MKEEHHLVYEAKVKTYLKNKEIFEGKFTEVRGCDDKTDYRCNEK